MNRYDIEKNMEKNRRSLGFTSQFVSSGFWHNRKPRQQNPNGAKEARAFSGRTWREVGNFGFSRRAI